VRRCAPILANHLAGKSDDEARAIIARMGWRASVVAPPLRVLVCGGRDYGDHEALFAALDAIHASIPIEVIIHGGAPGADYLASFWAAARAVNERRFPADWKRPDLLLYLDSEGWSRQRIAAELNLSSGAVYAALKRARANAETRA
jgi:hypothetical protein